MSDPRGFPRFKLGEPVSLSELQRINDTAEVLDRPTGPRLGYGRSGMHGIDGAVEWVWFRVTAKPDSPGYPPFFYSGKQVQENDDGTDWVDTPGGFICTFDGQPLIESCHREDVPADPTTGPVVKAKLGDNGDSWVFTFGASTPPVDFGDVPPVDPPDDITIINLYYDEFLNVVWVWNPVTLTWVSEHYYNSYFQWVPTYVTVFVGGNYTLLASDVKLAFAVSGDITINGFTGGVNGRLLVVWNRGTDKVIIHHGAGATDGVICPLHKDYTIWPDDAMIFEYDGTSLQWRFDCPSFGTAGSAGASVPDVYATRQINFASGLIYTDNDDGSVDVSVDTGDITPCISDFGTFIQGGDYTVTTTMANTGLSKTFSFNGQVHISFVVQGQITPGTLQEKLEIQLADGSGAAISGTAFTMLQAQVAGQEINGMGTIVYSLTVATGDTVQLQAQKQNNTSTTIVGTNSRITWFRLC